MRLRRQKILIALCDGCDWERRDVPALIELMAAAHVAKHKNHNVIVRHSGEKKNRGRFFKRS
jgi:hypothetical protein